MHINQENIVIPETLRLSILKIARCNSEHLDFKSNLTRIKQKYWCNDKICKNYTKSCIVSAGINRRTTMLNNNNRLIAYGTIGRRPIPHSPMDIIPTDHNT